MHRGLFFINKHFIKAQQESLLNIMLTHKKCYKEIDKSPCVETKGSLSVYDNSSTEPGQRKCE